MDINKRINNEASIATSGKSAAVRIITRMLVCLMLTFALVLPMAVPAEVFAVKSSSSASSGTSGYTTSRNQTISAIDIVFDQAVVTEARLDYAPSRLKAKGKRKSIKLTWTGAPAQKINGYYILRRDLGGTTWRQIATVGSDVTSYTDTTARKKNKCYRYSLVAYKKSGGKIKVSTAAGWAGALTTRSKKKNVTTVKVANLANVSIIMTGSCAQTYLKFPSKAYSKGIRWSSNNPGIARVDTKGLITGVSVGTTTIEARTHTGTINTFTVKVTKPGTAQAMIDTFYAWNGYSELNGKHKGIIDIYNSITPWPVGYKMKYSDAWCDATITAAAIKTGNVERIGRECSVPRHIKIFKKLGIWEEDGKITPRPGDIIVYSWSKAKQPNNNTASHIGLVVSVKGKQITCLEGNRGIGVVAERTIPVGWGFIRGYARPHYIK